MDRVFYSIVLLSAYTPPIPYASDIKILENATTISCLAANTVVSSPAATGIAVIETRPTIICSVLFTPLYFFMSR